MGGLPLIEVVCSCLQSLSQLPRKEGLNKIGGSRPMSSNLSKNLLMQFADMDPSY